MWCERCLSGFAESVASPWGPRVEALESAIKKFIDLGICPELDVQARTTGKAIYVMP